MDWKEIRDRLEKNFSSFVTMKEICEFTGYQYSKACELLYGLNPVLGVKGHKGAKYFSDHVAKRIVGLEVKE